MGNCLCFYVDQNDEESEFLGVNKDQPTQVFIFKMFGETIN